MLFDAHLNGNYYAKPAAGNAFEINTWHVGSVHNGLWSNEANVQWTLKPTATKDVFQPGPECPYYKHANIKREDLLVRFERKADGSGSGFRFMNDHFTLLDKEHLEYDGFYSCEAKMSGVLDLTHL